MTVAVPLQAEQEAGVALVANESAEGVQATHVVL